MKSIIAVVAVALCLPHSGIAGEQPPGLNVPATSAEASSEENGKAPHVPYSVTSQVLEAVSEESGATPKPRREFRHGRVVFIGPDGKRHEIEFPNGEISAPWKGRVYFLAQDGAVEGTKPNAPEPRERMVIGVSLQPIPAAVAAQLKLDDNAGVMIGHVQEDSPAAKSGLKQFDLITHAGDKAISSPSDLEEVIQKSEGKEMTLKVIHAGEAKEVAITPEKRKVPGFMVFDSQGGPILRDLDALNLWYAGPGVRLPGPPKAIPFPMPPEVAPPEREAMQKQLDEIRKQLDELREMIKKQQPSSAKD